MADPTKKNVMMSICTEGVAPTDADMDGAARQYATRVCGNDNVYSSFKVEVADAGTKMIEDSNYYCRSVNASFFCSEPQPVKGSNPPWEEKGLRKEKKDDKPHSKDYL